MDDFEKRNRAMVERMANDADLRDLTKRWFVESSKYEYSYHFKWMGLPIIQFPQDVVAMQEIIWDVQPDLIIETGMARGGSTVFYASMLELLGGKRQVISIDVDIRAHNRSAVESHPMHHRITLLEGSSVDAAMIGQVRELAGEFETVLVALDSNHTYEHVRDEIELYAPLVSPGSYLVVFDTIVEDLPASLCAGRPWGQNSNPKMAVREFLERSDCFEVDRQIQNRLLVTVAPDGYLRRMKK